MYNTSRYFSNLNAVCCSTLLILGYIIEIPCDNTRRLISRVAIMEYMM